MSDQDKHSDHRLREGYERLLGRLQDGAKELSWENLQQELDDAVEFEAEVEEFTLDELALLRAWVERDMREFRRHLATGGEGRGLAIIFLIGLIAISSYLFLSNSVLSSFIGTF